LKILLTGSFGNVGLSTLEELIRKNYSIRVLDIYNKKNRRIASKYKDQIDIIWGDLRNPKDVEKAVEGQHVVIHTAAIIPPLADKKPKFAESVNVGGTKNIINAMKSQPQKPKITKIIPFSKKTSFLFFRFRQILKYYIRYRDF